MQNVQLITRELINVEFGKMLAGDAWVPVDERYRKAWTLLVDAVEASRRPAGVRAAAAW